MRPVFVSAVAAVVACAFAVEPKAHVGAPPWSLERVLTSIDGAVVTIRHWRGRIQSGTTLCNGQGRGSRWGGERHWRHFTCTWTVFDRKGLVDRDVTFRVHTVTLTRFRISDARFGAA